MLSPSPPSTEFSPFCILQRRQSLGIVREIVSRNTSPNNGLKNYKHLMHTYSLRVYVTLFTVLAFTAVSAVPVEMSVRLNPLRPASFCITTIVVAPHDWLESAPRIFS